MLEDMLKLLDGMLTVKTEEALKRTEVVLTATVKEGCVRIETEGKGSMRIAHTAIINSLIMDMAKKDGLDFDAEIGMIKVLNSMTKAIDATDAPGGGTPKKDDTCSGMKITIETE